MFDQLGLAVTQSSSFPGNQVNAILPSSEFKEYIGSTFHNLISRIGRSKSHVAKSKFHKNFQLRHQNGRPIPYNLKAEVYDELKKLLAEKHILKLTNCPDEYFISPIVVTVKKEQTIDKQTKLSLDSNILIKAIHKNIYQKPN